MESAVDILNMAKDRNELEHDQVAQLQSPGRLGDYLGLLTQSQPNA